MSARIWHKFDTWVLLAVVLLFAYAPPSALAATPDSNEVVALAGPAGSVVPIEHWKMQSSSKAQESGRLVSGSSFSTDGWYAVSAHATVMAGLLENGEYPRIFHGTNLRDLYIPHGRLAFQIPWWYRTTFQVPRNGKELNTFVKVNGVIPSADVWLNGQEIANHDEVAGAFTTHEIDVTKLVHTGTNVLAVLVYPANPLRQLGISWIDWNPQPPGYDFGIWRDVDIVRTGPVSLDGLHILSKLAAPGLDTASLTVKATLRNNTNTAQTVVVNGDAAGVQLHRRVRVAAGQSQTVAFDPRTDPSLKLDHPKVWWPAGWGSQPLYRAALTVRVDGAVSDRSETTFGVRSVTSHLTKQGYRQFVVNGHPLLIRGAGWAPDMFLRDQPKRMAIEFRYLLNMGLNAIRTEGKIDRPDFYRLADREGILILPGWECCDEWEAHAKTGGEPWTRATFKVARESMATQAKLLRDHPSVIAFLIGSDNAPPAKVAKMYVDELRAADWPDPIVSAVSSQSTPAAGPSGLKMLGPYTWVPPIYWYTDKVGGAFGFNSESSAGADIPRLPTLRAMLTPHALRALWKHPEIKQYHQGPAWIHNNVGNSFSKALRHRFGAPKNLADYVEKAQVANYEAVRAEFEAYDAHMNAENPSTGLIYWMLDNAWPSLRWHLINYGLDPNGAYFGAKIANQPVHIQYSYDNRAVMAINHTLHSVQHLDARIRVYNLEGNVQYNSELTGIDLAPNHATRLAVIPMLKGLSSTYFVELELTDTNQRLISRNVYWLPTKFGELDYSKTTWDSTAITRYADLTELQKLPSANVKVRAHTRRDGERRVTTVTVTAPRSNTDVAFFVHLSIRQAPKGKPVVPILWSDNDVTLWPGQTATLTSHYRVKGKLSPVAEVSGWNVSPCSVSTDATGWHCGS